MINGDLLAERLSARFGIDIISEDLSLRISGIDPPNGFCVAISQGWRSIDATFIPDTFASGLIKTLCLDNVENRSNFFNLASVFALTGTRIAFGVNGNQVTESTAPGETWARIELMCTRLTDKSNLQQDSEEVATACLALLLALLAVTKPEEEEGLPEGAVSRIQVNRYERIPANRAAAISIHGTSCKVCGFDFSQTYGHLGDGFIEIHHRTPVSMMGAGYIVNPETDLVPLCANCHRMVHRENPPVEPEQLIEIIVNQKYR